MRALAGRVRDQLSDFLARQERAADDWSVAWTSPGGEDADRLARFLTSATQRTLEWPLAEPRRRSVHLWLDDADLPVTHVTRRTGRPFTLVLTKTRDLFTREESARRKAGEHLVLMEKVIDGDDACAQLTTSASTRTWATNTDLGDRPPYCRT